MLFTKAFWRAAIERVIMTIAQAGIAAIGVGAIGFGDVDWLRAGSVAGVAGILSLLKSIVINASNGGEGPAINRSEIVVGDIGSYDENGEPIPGK